MLKITSEATANLLQKLLNESLETSTFPNILKLADITPLFKKIKGYGGAVLMDLNGL